MSWFEKILQALGIIRSDLDAILGAGETLASRLDAHAVRAGADRDYHDEQADKHSEASDAAHAEVLRAVKVASNVRAIFAV